MPMPETNNLALKFFKEKEIFSTEEFYNYDSRKKIVVYVPFSKVDLLTMEMSKAGAGQIGNYDMCSFRTEGTGTFRPNKKAKPFTGKKNILNYEEEVKLEMECSSEQTDKVISAMLKNHPYDEAAYEIYDFKKRDTKAIGVTIVLKKELTFGELFKRINRTDLDDELLLKHNIKRPAMVNSDTDETIIESAKFINCDCIISQYKKKIKLILL